MPDTTENAAPVNQPQDEIDPRLTDPVEAAAMRADASAVGQGLPKGDERLNLYRLVPIAEAYDPRWDNSPFQGEVVVAARSTGDARLVASSRELDYMEIDAKPAEDVTTSTASAFRSEKLYTVIEIDRDRTDLSRGIVDGEIAIDVIRPVQD